MRPKISISKLNFYIRQEYGFKDVKQFFNQVEHAPKLHHKVLESIVREFTGYKLINGKLATFNPYTQKHETLNISNFKHIRSKDDLMKELSMLHKDRMNMLTQSRKRILELSKKKKKTRDKDLESTAEAIKDKRMNELGKQSEDKSKEQSLER